MSKTLVYLLLISTAVLCGCASLVRGTSTVFYGSLLRDDFFPGYQTVEIETQENIFYLSNEAKAFAEHAVNLLDNANTPKNKIRSFTYAIFDHSNLDLLYLSSANTVASETFNNQAANCLSMSIMVYAMAKHVGFKASFQNVVIPEYWTRQEGFSLLNGHINVEVYPKRQSGTVYLVEEGIEIDFDPLSSRAAFKKEPLKERQILSMFYNNKGADALINKEYTQAYAYLRQSLIVSPTFQSAWVNMGYLYRTNGLLKDAEQAYLTALSIDKNNTSAIENLAYLYKITDRQKDARILLARLNQKLQSNPYYHLNLGEQDFDGGFYTEALEHYRTALELDKSTHEIYFGLAKVHFALGNIKRSQRYLLKAKKTSNNRQDQSLYQGKLDLLNTASIF